MKQFIVPVVLSTAVLWAADQAIAQGRSGGSKPKGTSGAVSHGGGSSTHGGGSATHGGGSATHGGGTKTHGGSVQHGSAAKPTKSGSHTKTTTGSPKTAKSNTTATPSTTTTSASTTTAATGSATTLTAVQQKLQRNSNLADKLQSRLPKGTDVIAAAADFRNLGQYVAAVNVSKNLDLDFTKLKTAMVDDGMSLGQAIKAQRSSLDGTTEAVRAQREADALIASTESTTQKTSTKTKAKAKTTKDDQQ